MGSGRIEFAAMGALLRQGRLLAALSLLLLAVSLLAVLFVPVVVKAAQVGLVVLAASLQLYYAMRVDLDARLFEALARDGEPKTASTRLDAALRNIGLLRGEVPDRPWPRRFAGARGLLLKQAGCIAVQALALAWLCWR